MKKKTKVYVGMDVHKDSVMVAVLPEGEREPALVKRLSHDPRGLRRLLDRLAREHEVRACYEASGAGYVLERKERVRDLVRCRGTFQRETLRSRHYILKFVTRRGLVYREGKNWTLRHMMWLRAIQRDAVLETDQVAFGEYLALLDHKLDRREELDRQIEVLALKPSYKEAVGRLCCPKGISTQAAMVLVTEIGAAGLDHEGGQQPGPGIGWCRRRGTTASHLGEARC